MGRRKGSTNKKKKPVVSAPSASPEMMEAYVAEQKEKKARQIFNPDFCDDCLHENKNHKSNGCQYACACTNKG